MTCGDQGRLIEAWGQVGKQEATITKGDSFAIDMLTT